MNIDFQKKWKEVLRKKKSLIVAGCDPTLEILNGEDVFVWCKKYLEEVSLYVAGIKVNPKYFFKFPNGNEIMKYIADFCREKDLISIFDEKLSEVGHSNFEGSFAAKSLGFDAVTIAAFAGNAKEVINFCKQNNIAAINMGLMSNPEFSREAEYVNPKTGKFLWEDRLQESLDGNIDALVIGGNFTEANPVFQEFLKQTRISENLFLVPGLGAQGGDPKVFLESVMRIGADPKRFMLNFGRSLMLAGNRQEYLRELNISLSKYFSEQNSELKKLK